MRGLIQDLRHGFRVSLKSQGFLCVAVLTLAIGIAANTTVFSWIDTVLVRPIPGVANSRDLVSFETVTPSREFITTSYADYRDYRDHLKQLAGLTVAQPRALSLGEQDHAERVWGELVAGNYFAILGVRPELGRVFSPDEYGDKQGGYPVAVISHGLWQRFFNADPAVVGKTVRVNRQLLTVVGVVPGDFRGSISGLAFEIWIPAMMATHLNLMPDWMLQDRQTRSFVALARMKPGVSIDSARAEIATVAEELGKVYPRTNKGIGATVLPLWQAHFGAQTMLLGPLRILMAVCAVVLLIVCANVANLLLARAMSRKREFGIRMALGAGRLRLVRQLFVETLVLGALGAAIGAPLSIWMGRSLEFLVPRGVFPVRLEVPTNPDMLAFVVVICLIACVISGVAPALHVVRGDFNDALKEGGRSGSASAASQRIRRLLVVSEVALALVAIIGAGLFAKSFQAARKIHPGFDTANVLVSHLYLSSAGYSVPERKLFCRQLRERLEAEPGVVNVAYADSVPLGFEGSAWEDLQIEGYVPGPSENMKIDRNVVAPGFFDLMRIPLLDGRDFTERDDENSNPVMVVSETFAHRFFHGRNPLGYKVHGWGKWFTIVGVVKDTKYHRPNEPSQPYFYVPFRQVYRADLAIAFYVRMAGDPARGLAAIRRETRSLDPNVGVFDAMPLAESITASLFPQKVAASLLGALGTIALLLAAVGLYSLMAYSISQRTQELGIRMALGATPFDVLKLVVRQGMSLTAAGLLVGIAVAVAVTRVAAGMLVDVSATDPLIFAGAVLFLALISLLASYVPARRATRIDPIIALRYQ
jgi:predicted permease